MLRFALPLLLLAWAAPAAAFGAGNIASISKVEGKNWRHGDIEDVLLGLAAAHAFNKGKNFSKMMIKQVYLGNWCRDYSQAIDVGTVKAVSAEAIRLLLCVLGFMTFGYGSGEFEITADRLGCYRPEEHIDNPKNYADNVDARRYDRRLRGPVNDEAELSIDPETGMKNYISNERAGITTSAGLLRHLLGTSIELGRRYKRSGDKRDMHESLRLLGTGLHCLEDFFAHSNYCELALIEIGEQSVFPHVGRDTMIRLQGARDAVYPIVTGTFGGVDFLHSVTGEVSDKMTQNEIDELEGTIIESKNSDTSMLRELLDMIPDGIFGNKHESDKVDQLQQNANNAQMQNMNISPREPEEFTRYVQDIYRQVMPAIEFHDEVMKGITSAIESIPVLPKVVEQLEEELSRFVFSVIAPYVVPLIRNIKNELMTGSSEIIESSEKEQHIVFHDHNSSDPTHSMLAKDHFSNILNEIAGQCAAKMVCWVVPQLMEAIDNESVDVDRLLTVIINGVMHHPAQRDTSDSQVREGRRRIYQSVKEWWREMGSQQQDEYRRKLSREGVLRGENHKEGVHDTGHGHGCNGKLKMQKLYGEPRTMEDKIADAAAGAIIDTVASTLGGSGGGDVGGIIGGLLGSGTAASLLGGAFGEEKKEKKSKSYRDDEGYHKVRKEKAYDDGHYGKASYKEHHYSDGSKKAEYKRYESNDDDLAYGEYVETEERTYQQLPGGGYAQTHRGEYRGGEADSYTQGFSQSEYQSSNYSSAHTYQRQESSYTSQYSRQEQTSYSSGGGYSREESSYSGGYGDSRGHGYGSGDEKKKHKKKDHDHDDYDKKKYKKKDYDNDDDDYEKKKYKKKDCDDDNDDYEKKKYKKKDSDSGDDYEKKKYKKKEYDSGDDYEKKKYKKKEYDSGDDYEKKKYKKKEYDSGDDYEKKKYKKKDYDNDDDDDYEKKKYKKKEYDSGDEKKKYKKKDYDSGDERRYRY